MVVSGLDRALGNINLHNFQLMVAQIKINLRETHSALKLVKKIINPRKRVLIFLCGLIQLKIVIHIQETYLPFAQKVQEYPIEKYLDE